MTATTTRLVPSIFPAQVSRAVLPSVPDAHVCGQPHAGVGPGNVGRVDHGHGAQRRPSHHPPSPLTHPLTPTLTLPPTHPSRTLHHHPSPPCTIHRQSLPRLLAASPLPHVGHDVPTTAGGDHHHQHGDVRWPPATRAGVLAKWCLGQDGARNARPRGRARGRAQVQDKEDGGGGVSARRGRQRGARADAGARADDEAAGRPASVDARGGHAALPGLQAVGVARRRRPGGDRAAAGGEWRAGAPAHVGNARLGGAAARHHSLNGGRL